MFKHICKNCLKNFTHRKRNRIYCSAECFYQDRKQGPFEHICQWCNKEYQNTKKNSVYCSPECQHKGMMKPPDPPRICCCGCGTIIYRKRFQDDITNTFVPTHQFRGANNHSWKGGKKINSDGYIFLLKPDHPNAKQNGYVRESHFVMSEHLDRPIATNEVVHHINGNPSDNCLENLVLMTRRTHATHHHKGLIKPNSLKNLNHNHPAPVV